MRMKLEIQGVEYEAEIEFEDDMLYGEVLGITDEVTFCSEGISLQDEFKTSVEDYLAFCKERGEEPEKP